MKNFIYSLKAFGLVGFFLLGSLALANNIKVSNISLEDMNESQNYVMVEFDVSWENSWRLSTGPANWDAAWIIIKYRKNGGDWNHALLSTTGAVAPAGSTVNVAPDNTGAMIYRSADGSGDVDYQNIRLRWDFGNNISSSDMIDVQVFGMEMVYVTEGAFYLGSYGGNEDGRIHAGGNENLPYYVTSENAISVANSVGNLYYKGGLSPGDFQGPIPANFPKGFQAFYCMKYEITQSQWVNFFNTLTHTQKIANDITDNSGKNTDDESIRNAVSWLDTGKATTTNPDVPLNFVSFERANAFLDWAGLRLMTEFEFVKACRGPLEPVNNEFAWGSTNITSTEYIFSGLGTPNELIHNIDENTGNVIYGRTNGPGNIGPRRNGILAASSINHTREETGGTYYGIMEMSGNLYERAVNIASPLGRSFIGNHGDGVLPEDGLNNVIGWNTDWPWNAIGSLGGGSTDSYWHLEIASRHFAEMGGDASAWNGFRGVRTAF